MTKSEKKIANKESFSSVILLFIFIELLIFLALVFTVLSPTMKFALAVVGAPNATVRTTLNVGAVAPEILSILINNGSAVDLVANSTYNLTVYITARDYNGETGIQNVSVVFFDSVGSSYGAADDNNMHYTNQSCNISTAYGDQFQVNATCTIFLWYYANNQTWNATVTIIDNSTLNDTDSNTTTVNALLALALPDSIDYGTVNATRVSDEQIANVTNAGNVLLNLSLSGYAVSIGDNLSMNCSYGNVQNISINYEKYNLTTSNTSSLSLSQFESIYTNLTTSAVIKTFNLAQRQNDTNTGFDDRNQTYWRMYVPVGVAGSCTGNIVFGATQGTGT